MAVTVIIPSRNDSNVVACVEAVRRCEPSMRMMIVDDGLSLDWLPRPDLMPAFGIKGEKPFIFARNCNKGIRAVGRDDVILLNDDAILETPGGFSLMADAANGCGIVSAVTNSVGNRAQHPKNGGALRYEPDVVAFVCVYIPRSTIDTVGMLDERFTAYGWEDNDYCRRVREAGLKIGIFDGCFVDHQHLESTFRPGNGCGDIGPGRRIYEEKWGRS